MVKKLPQCLYYTATVLALCSCNYLSTHTPKDILSNPWSPEELNKQQQAVDIQPAQLRLPSSIVVCRSHQCAPAKLSMSKEYIYNSLLQLFENNNYQKALICQADPNAHTCLENFVALPITAGITPTNAYIDHVKITDVIIGKSANKLNLILNYNLTYGGQTPDCTPSQTILFAKNVNHVIMEDASYTCKMTSIGQTTVKTVFAIDYIDLDYGYIGGSYSIGLSGPAYGGGNGYMMLRLPKNAYPLAPVLQAPRNMGKQTTMTGVNNGQTAESVDNADGTTSNGVQIFPINRK